MDLSRICAAPSARLGRFPFEGDRSFPTQCRVSAAGIMKAVDVFKDRHLSLPPGFPRPPPDQLGLDGLEERLDGGIVITIALAAHGHSKTTRAQDHLVVMRTVLATPVAVKDASLGRRN